MSYHWFLLIPAALTVVPQLITRNAGGNPLFGGDDAWINRGVRFAAFCTFCVFALYFIMQSKA